MEVTLVVRGALRRLFVFNSDSLSRHMFATAGAAFAVALAGFLVVPEAAAGSSAVGAIVGTGGVSADGAATYNISITLPPGTHSMQPSLALVYDSQSGEGLAGYGWSLSGLSAITRCAATIASDGGTQAVQLNGPGMNSDDFCLDGQRLRVISGTYGANGATYGTEIEAFSRIVSHGSSTGPSWFTVQMKNGRVYEYGNTTDSKIYAQGTTIVRSWALDKVTDLNGNYMTYQYQQDTDDGDYWPLYINYTGNGNAGTTPDHQVEFDYVARPNVIAAYIQGSLVTQTKLLANIKVNYAGATTFNYKLAYQTADATGRSHLTSVTECGADGSCLPSTGIAWRSGQAAGWGADTPTPAAVTNATAVAAAKLMDVDGDGVMDLVYPDSNPNSNTWKVMWGDPNGGFTSTITDTGISASSWYGLANTLQVDYNGDGLQDLAVPMPNAADGSGRGYLLLVSQGSRSNPIFRTPGNDMPSLSTAYTENGSVWPVDFHGSGASDLVYSDGSSVYLYSNSGSNYSGRSTVYTLPSSAPQTSGKGSDFISKTSSSTYSNTPFDFDGSGRAGALMLDTVSTTTKCIPEPGYPCGTTTSTDFYWDAYLSNDGPGYTPFASLRAASLEPVPVDVNGDGLSDLLFTASLKLNNIWLVGISTGAGFNVLQTQFQNSQVNGVVTSGPIVADYYGDGKQDAIIQTDSTTWTLLNVSYAPGSGFSIANVSLPNLLPSNYANGSLRVGNIDADGQSDLVYAVSNSALTSFTWHYKLHKGVAPDLVSSITDGMGNVSQFQYASLASGAPVYTEGSGAQYPVQDVQAPMQVVSTYTQSNGIGGTYSTSYAYSGARMDPHGRGFLGFASVTSTDSRNGNQETATYDQAFPWIGQVTNDVSSLQGSGGYFEIHGTNKSAADYIAYGSGFSTRYLPYFDTTISHDYDPASVASGSQGAQIRKTTTSLASSVNNRSSTSFDAYGNTIDSTTQVQDLVSGDIFTAETIADFGNDYDLNTYCVSLPKTVTITKTPPSGPAASRIVQSNVDTSHCALAAGANASSPSTTSTSDASGSPSLSTSYTYDSFGNVTQTVISGSGIASTLSTGGRTTGATYTGDGEFSTTSTAQVTDSVALTSHDTWRYDFGVEATSTDPNGLVTSTQYDGYGRPVKVTKPDGTAVVRTYQWCSAGPVFPCPAGAVYEVSTSQIANDGKTTVYTGYSAYDALGRVVEAGQVMLGGVVSTVDTTYDRYGQKVSVTKPYTGATPQFSTTYGYFNQTGQPKSVQAPSPQDSQASCYPNCLDVTTYSYSGFTTTGSSVAGDASDLTDGATQSTVTVTDALGRNVKVTDANGAVTTFSYDASGNATSTVDADGKTLAMSYDGLGHKTGMVDPNMGTWSYQVDALGEMLCQTDANQQSIIFTYDNVGRITSKLETAQGAGCQAGAGTLSTWTYDAPGALGLAASMGDSNGFQQTYSYDALVRPSDTVTTVGGTSYDVSTVYDGFGRVEATTYPASVTPTASGTTPTAAAAITTSTPGLEGTPVTLDGSGSTDPNGLGLQYQWTQTGGPTLNVGAFDSAAQTTSFTPPAGGVYSFQLQVIDSSSGLSAPAAVSLTVKPTVPPAPKVTSAAADSGVVGLSWKSIANADSYDLYQSTDGTTFTFAQNVADTGTGTETASVSNLVNGTYYFALVAKANNVSSDQGPAVSAQMVFHAPVPTGLWDDGDSDHNGNYTLRWNAVTAPGTTVTYHLEEAVGNSSGATGSYSEKWSGTFAPGVQPNVAWGHPGNGSYYYYYRVRASNVNGYSDYSAIDGIHVVVRPAVPGAFNPASQSAGTGAFTITWGKSSGPIVSAYQLFEDTASNFPSETYVGSTTATSMGVSVPVGTTEYFRVRACNVSDSVTVCSDWRSYATATHNYPSGGNPGDNCNPICPFVLNDDFLAAVQPGSVGGMDMSISQTVSPLAELVADRLHPVALPEAAQPSSRVARAVPQAQGTLVRLQQERRQLIAAAPAQPSEAALQMRLDRRDGAAVAFAQPSAKHLPAYAPPVYRAYAGARLAKAINSPYRFTVQDNYDTASGQLLSVSNADTGFIYWRAATDSGNAPVDAFGHIVAYVDGNNVSTVTAYDPATGIVTGIGTGVGQNSNVQLLTYSWDSFGNLKQRCDANRGLVENFTYDGVNRMKSSAVSSGLTPGTCAGGSPGAAIGMSYDAIGNVQVRSNTGLGINDSYSYDDPAHPYAVTGVTSMPGTYQYDANGNMVAGNGRAIAWNDANLPVTITSTGTVSGNLTVTGSSTFSYGPDHARYQQVTTDSVAGNSTTVYVGGLFEVVTTAAGVQYRHNIVADGQTVAVHTLDQSGTARTAYIHSDHLGSGDTLTDDSGNVIQQMSFDAFGMRRDPSNWAYDLTSAQVALLKGNTDRGYTMQEQLDSVALIHMNGRLYDPTIDRMISADPTIQGTPASQAYNRYAYVADNPLRYTDPSGYCWLCLSTFTNPVSVLTGIPMPASTAQTLLSNATDALKHPSVMFEDTNPFVGHYINDAMARSSTLRQVGGYAAMIVSFWVGPEVYAGYEAYITDVQGGTPLQDIGAGVAGYMKAYEIDGFVAGGESAFAANQWTGLGEYVAKTGAHDVANRYFQREMARFAAKNGMTVLQLDVEMFAFSYLGKEVVGSRFTTDFEGGGHVGITGFFSNDGGLVTGGWSKPLDFVFDVNDTLLAWQGIPDASSIDLLRSGFNPQSTIYGHSLGALDVSNLQAEGWVKSSTLYALPFGSISPYGSQTHLEWDDPISGGPLGVFTSPSSTVTGSVGGVHSFQTFPDVPCYPTGN